MINYSANGASTATNLPAATRNLRNMTKDERIRLKSIDEQVKRNMQSFLDKPELARTYARTFPGVNLNAFYGDLERLGMLRKVSGKYRVTSMALDRQIREEFDHSRRNYRFFVLPAGKLVIMQLWLAGMLTMKTNVGAKKWGIA